MSQNRRPPSDSEGGGKEESALAGNSDIGVLNSSSSVAPGTNVGVRTNTLADQQEAWSEHSNISHQQHTLLRALGGLGGRRGVLGEELLEHA